MVLKENVGSDFAEAKWIGCHDPNVIVSSLVHKNVYFYRRCIIGALTLSLGDYVLVCNADAPEPDTVDGCDIARILHMYELREMTDKDPCRAIVQWYSRPECVPHKQFDSDEICVDFSCEVIEEHRPYDSDISLETILRKCNVICGTVQDSACGILSKCENKRNSNSCPMFVCRYKFIKEKTSYRLVPLAFTSEAVSTPTAAEAKFSKKNILRARTADRAVDGISTRKSKSATLRRRASMSATASAVEFIDVENKVSPIKIVGGRSVVRLSVSAKKQSKKKRNEIDANYLPTSPLSEKNRKVFTPNSKVAAARRNLNLSLDNGEANSTVDSECLNYSIVNTSNVSEESSNNDIKIKLRISERRRSTRFASMEEEEDPLALDNANENVMQRKRAAYLSDLNTPINNVYCTPKKKTKDTDGTEMTPSTRRKSILKSATTRLAEGTPKRSIQLSNIVEKRIFKDDDIITTPKFSRKKSSHKNNADNYDSDDVTNHTPKKTATKKTPTRNHHSSTKQQTTEIRAGEKTPLTPSQKLKLIRSGDISPTIEKRSATHEKQKRKSELELARERLHVSVVPQSLPCREKEFNNIYTFLEGKIQDQSGGCMYVSGVPGTGKTATVTGVIRKLQQKVAEDDLQAFDYLEINGMRLTEPRQAYVHIYRQLTGKTVSWEHAHSLLEKRFTTAAPRRTTTVLLVDELDILCNRRQDVVYNLLDWPTKSAARLVVVTIANTMDLPERVLMGKVTSRMGLTRLTFQPYAHKQLQEIVTARLCGSEAFKSDAVQLVARKVAAVSGDARRALDICRRATEIAECSSSSTTATNVEISQHKIVNMLHVQQALGEMIASAKVQAIKNCSRIEQIFLQAIAAEVTRTGVEETTFSGVYTQIETIAAFMGTAVPTTGGALRICSKLGAQRLIICEHSRNDIFQKILLNVSTDDIHYALRVNNNSSNA